MSLRRGIVLIASLAIVLAYGLLRNGSGAPVGTSSRAADKGNDSLSLIVEPSDGIAPIIDAIAHASSSVDVVLYQFEDPQVEQALAADEARGIRIRVLLNGGYYSKKESDDNDAAQRFLSSHGIDVAWTPSYFALTHQKTIVIDGDTAYIMTFNLTPQYYASSRDFAIIDRDTGDVSAIESAFNDDWNKDYIPAPIGSDLVWSPGSEQSLIALIDSAATSLDIYNEEMADTAVTNALCDAAKRGVAVKVVMTDQSSWHKAFATLSKAGVEVRTYSKKDSLYIHAKMIVADDKQAFLGSENFSSGSLKKNRELGIVFDDPAIIAQLESVFSNDFARATHAY